MRMRNPKDKDEILNSCSFFYDKEVGFENDNPICLEIGMGKGDFLLGMALNNPNINYVGVEKYSSVLSVAIKKIREYDLPNLKVLNMDAALLGDIFKNNIDTIYLNFSDPWPKKRHAKRRLTSDVFLKVYDGLFTGIPHIIMKTDNDNLFAYSLESLKEYGYTLDRVEYDLHKTDISNVETEYEHKFSSKGVNIKFLDAKKYSRDI
jgi:tRNA (guanine-N7-)-methyltransferase